MNPTIFVALSILFTIRLLAYEGEEEVHNIFSQIVDIKNPTLEEYKLIEEFLVEGDRPYLKPFGTAPTRRSCRTLKLVGDHDEMPIRKIFPIGCSLDDKNRCIVIYSSYNYPYPGKAQLLLNQIKECGYVGHVLFRVGGYPNMSNDGLKLCHIPYAWKVAGLLEARSLGYRYILWIDSSVHPLSDLHTLFEIIEEKAFLSTSAGFNLDYPYSLGEHLSDAIHALNLRLDQLVQIPHMSCPLIGLDTENDLANDFLDDWYATTLQVEPCINFYPEELCYSVVAWRHELNPTYLWWEILFTKFNYHSSIRHQKPLYLEFNRKDEPQWDPAELN